MVGGRENTMNLQALNIRRAVFLMATAGCIAFQMEPYCIRNDSIKRKLRVTSLGEDVAAAMVRTLL